MTEELCDCGYPLESFACKIRHLHLNSGEAKAAKDIADAQQERKYGV